MQKKKKKTHFVILEGDSSSCDMAQSHRPGPSWLKFKAEIFKTLLLNKIYVWVRIKN